MRETRVVGSNPPESKPKAGWRLAVLATAALVAWSALAAGPAPAAAAENDEIASLEPRRYVSLEWARKHKDTVHTILEICPPPPGSLRPCRPPWEVIGTTGNLRVKFDRARMKQDFELDSRGAVAIWGYLTRPEGEPLPIEIPGYSQFGEKLTVVDMDLSAASNLVTQMLQGAELAARIQAWAAEAKLADLLAQQKAYENLAAIELEVLAETKRALLRIYEQCLRWGLESRDISEAAAALAKAEARRDAAPKPAAAGQAAAIATFFGHVTSQKVSFQTWLDELLGPETAPYLGIVAGLVDKSEGVIRANAAEVQDLVTKIEAGSLDPAGQAAAMHRLIEVAEIVRALGDDLILRHRNLNRDRIAALETWPQLAAGRPAGFDFGDIRSTKDIVAECIHAVPPPSPTEPEGLRAGEAGKRAGEWLEQLRALLYDITREARYRQVSQKARESFEKQILVFLDEHDRNVRAAKSVENALALAKHEVGLTADAFEDEACMNKLKTQRDFIKVVLMVEVLDHLIRSIPDVTLPLKKLGLEVGDQLAIVVSLLPRASLDKPPPEQFRTDFHVSNYGWQGAKWRKVKGQVMFVRAEKDTNYAPRAGVAALWNFHGKSPKRKAPLRALAPGVGIGAIFLDFDDDEASVEVGLGLTVTLFQDLLHLTYGYNLQAETGDGGRNYFGIGLSLTDLVGAAKGED